MSESNFRKAFESVERIWDFDRHCLKDGVSGSDIRLAVSSVNTINDAELSAPEMDMKALLTVLVKDALKEHASVTADAAMTQEPGKADYDPADHKCIALSRNRSREIKGAMQDTICSSLHTQTIEKVNKPEKEIPEEEKPSGRKRADDLTAEFAVIDKMSLEEIIASIGNPNENEEREAIMIGEDNTTVIVDDELECEEDEGREWMTAEELAAEREEYQEKLERKREQQKEAARKKALNQKWWNRLRAMQARQREAQERYEEDAKALSSGSLATKMQMEETARSSKVHTVFEVREEIRRKRKEQNRYQQERGRAYSQKSEEPATATAAAASSEAAVREAKMRAAYESDGTEQQQLYDPFDKGIARQPDSNWQDSSSKDSGRDEEYSAYSFDTEKEELRNKHQERRRIQEEQNKEYVRNKTEESRHQEDGLRTCSVSYEADGYAQQKDSGDCNNQNAPDYFKAGPSTEAQCNDNFDKDIQRQDVYEKTASDGVTENTEEPDIYPDSEIISDPFNVGKSEQPEHIHKEPDGTQGLNGTEPSESVQDFEDRSLENTSYDIPVGQHAPYNFPADQYTSHDNTRRGRQNGTLPVYATNHYDTSPSYGNDAGSIGGGQPGPSVSDAIPATPAAYVPASGHGKEPVNDSRSAQPELTGGSKEDEKPSYGKELCPSAGIREEIGKGFDSGQMNEWQQQPDPFETKTDTPHDARYDFGNAVKSDDSYGKSGQEYFPSYKQDYTLKDRESGTAGAAGDYKGSLEKTYGQHFKDVLENSPPWMQAVDENRIHGSMGHNSVGSPPSDLGKTRVQKHRNHFEGSPETGVQFYSGITGAAAGEAAKGGRDDHIQQKETKPFVTGNQTDQEQKTGEEPAGSETGKENQDDYSDASGGYLYGKTGTSGSVFTDAQAQAREDDHETEKAEINQKQKERADSMARKARDDKARADAFSDERHSSMRSRGESIEQHKSFIENVDTGNKSAKLSDTSGSTFHTGHTIGTVGAKSDGIAASHGASRIAGGAAGGVSYGPADSSRNVTGVSGRTTDKNAIKKAFPDKEEKSDEIRHTGHMAEIRAQEKADQEKPSSGSACSRIVRDAYGTDRAYAAANLQNGQRTDRPHIIASGSDVGKKHTDRAYSGNLQDRIEEKASNTCSKIRKVSLPASIAGEIAFTASKPISYAREKLKFHDGSPAGGLAVKLGRVMSVIKGEPEADILSSKLPVSPAAVPGKPVRTADVSSSSKLPVSPAAVPGTPVRTSDVRSSSQLASAQITPSGKTGIAGGTGKTTGGADPFHTRTTTFDRETGDYVRMEKDGSCRILKSGDEIRRIRQTKSSGQTVKDPFDAGGVEKEKRKRSGTEKVEKRNPEKESGVEETSEGVRFERGEKPKLQKTRDNPDTKPLEKGSGKWQSEGKDEQEKDKSTPFEAAVGAKYAKRTGAGIESAAKTGEILLKGMKKGVTQGASTVSHAIVDETNAGKGYYEIKKRAGRAKVYAGGAIALVSLSAGAVKGTGIVGSAAVNNVGSAAGAAMRAGWQYFRGAEAFPEVQAEVAAAKMSLKSNVHVVSISGKGTSERLRTLMNRRAKAEAGGREINLAARYLIGDSGERLNLKLINADILSLRDAILSGNATAAKIADLRDLKELRAIARSQQAASSMESLRANIKGNTRSIRNVGSMLVGVISASDNAMGRGVGYAWRTVMAGASVTRATRATMRFLGRTKTGKTVKGAAAHAAKGTAGLAAKGAFAAGKLSGKAALRSGVAIVNLGLKGANMSAGALLKTDFAQNNARLKSLLEAKSAYIRKLRQPTGEDLKRLANGGLYNKVIRSKPGQKASKLFDSKAKPLLNAGKKDFNKVSGAAFRIGGGITTAVKAVTDPVTAARESSKKALKWVAEHINPWTYIPSTIKKFILAIVLALFVLMLGFTLIGISLTTLTMMIDTSTGNLQLYIDYAAEQSLAWYDGSLEDSRREVSGRMTSLNEVYGKGDNPKGRYRIITTKYVDRRGRECESGDNIKEILSMVAVKTQNSWPDDWGSPDAIFGKDGWRVNDLKNIIRHLYAASHTWEAVESDPYVYYKEVNNEKVRLLKDSADDEYRQSYTSGDYEYVKLTGDAEGEACEGPRDFKCTEGAESLPEYCSQFRKRLNKAYAARGGCAVDYSGYGIYNAADDTFVPDGQFHDGTGTIYHMSEQIWANTDILARKQTADENRTALESGRRITVGTDYNAYIVEGEGDEIRYAHGLDSSSRRVYNQEYAPFDWIHYDEKFSGFKHGAAGNGDMGTAPDPWCSDYRMVYQGHKHPDTEDSYYPSCENPDIENMYGLPIYSWYALQDYCIYSGGRYWCSFTWNAENSRYETASNRDGYYSYLDWSSGGTAYHNSVGGTLWYYYNDDFGCWIPNKGTRFRCNEDVYRYYCSEELYNYTCHDYEAYCDGHRVRVTKYYCPGHTEYWCDGSHIDLDVKIHVAHLEDLNDLYHVDVDNEYDYKRKAIAVSKYPEDIDKMAENSETDFYWDEENRDSAYMLSVSKWTEIYDGITGVDDISVELVDDDLNVYLEYIDCKHIKEWKKLNGVLTPYGTNGFPLDVAAASLSGTGTKWFFDETEGVYVNVKQTRNVTSTSYYSAYEIVGRRTTSPSEVSKARRRLIEIALQAVGKIPYADVNTNVYAGADNKTMIEPTSDIINKTTVSVNGENVTLNVGNAFAFGHDEDTGEINYDDYEYGLDSGGFVEYVLGLLDKTLHTNRYQLSNTHNIEKIWELTQPVVGSSGNKPFGTRNTVTDEDLLPGDLGFINSYDGRRNDYEDAVQTEEDLLPWNTTGIYLGSTQLGERIWIQCSKSSHTVTVTTSNAFNYFRRIPALGDS